MLCLHWFKIRAVFFEERIELKAIFEGILFWWNVFSFPLLLVLMKWLSSWLDVWLLKSLLIYFTVGKNTRGKQSQVTKVCWIQEDKGRFIKAINARIEACKGFEWFVSRFFFYLSSLIISKTLQHYLVSFEVEWVQEYQGVWEWV